MRRQDLFAILVIATTAMVGFGASASAGDLNPPPGPIAPTMKTLTEVEPRVSVQSLPGSATAIHVISAPGSYYLTGNITGVSGKNGIETTADGVTLDLNGYSLIGQPGSLEGISVLGDHLNLSIRNGSVRNWGQDGVDAFNADNSTLDAIHASNNGAYGLRVRNGSTVINCTSRGNAGNGINIGESSLVSHSTATLNGGAGFELGDHSSAIACVATTNGQVVEAAGISAAVGCTVTDCTVSSNNGTGIVTNLGCTVTGCAARANTAIGIALGDGSTARDCVSNGNTSFGITAGNHSTIRTSTVHGNQGGGIIVGGSCNVVECVAKSNTGDGIRIILGQAIGNISHQNTEAGIHATEQEGSIIRENNVVSNARGIDVDVTGGLVVGNSARSNGVNYDIVPGNLVGPITSDPSTSSPLANLEY